MINPKLANGVIVVVTAVWVVSFIYSLVSPAYRADPQINLIFMSIVGGSIALKLKGTKPDDNA